MKNILLLLIGGAALGLSVQAWAGPYAPAAGIIGSTAVPADSAAIRGWATGVVELVRGPEDISAAEPRTLASFGLAGNALGAADALFGDAFPVVSLGDGGRITLSFAKPIGNGPGADFAVFENSFSNTFLELAFVEVSSNGTDFFRFASRSLTQTINQIDQASLSFAAIDASNIDGLAGKYRAGFGTPFDLALLAGASPLLNIDSVIQVRLIDVVGSLNALLGSKDSAGSWINDPWKTAFASGGFDLDAVAVLNQAVPEPGVAWFLILGGCFLQWRHRRYPGSMG